MCGDRDALFMEVGMNAVDVGGRRGRRGATLIIVLGVLIILALLATTFATIQIMERNISRNYFDDVQSKLIDSGFLKASDVGL